MKYFNLFVLFLLVTSCDKEYGCTDFRAINYNSSAILEDHTCHYQISGTLFWKNNKCDFENDAITSLNISINGQSIASDIDLENYVPCSGINSEFYEPTCDSSYYDYPKFSVITSAPISKGMVIEVFDQNQTLLRSFEQDIESIYSGFLKCKQIELKF
jgi:hypothetical protein